MGGGESKEQMKESPAYVENKSAKDEKDKASTTSNVPLSTSQPNPTATKSVPATTKRI